MSARLDPQGTGTDRVVWALLLVAVVALLVMVGLLVRVGVAGDSGQVRLRIDNQAGLALQVDVDDAAGARMGPGPAPPGAVTTVQVADIGPTWSFLASYGGQAVFRQELSKAELERQGWTVRIPRGVTVALEQAGYR